MTQVLYAFILFLVAIPLTTILKVNGIDVNVLPLQTAALVALLAYGFDIFDKKISTKAIVGLLVLGIFLFLHSLVAEIQIADVIKNTLTVFLVVMVILSLQWPPKMWITQNVCKVLYVFFLIFSIVSLILLMQHVRLDGWASRFKGFGSGTVHALMCMLGVLYLLEGLFYKRLKFLPASPQLAILLTSIVATQSRGVILSFLLLLALLSIRHFKLRLAFYSIPFLIVLFFLPAAVDVSEIPVLKRFDIEEFDDVEQFTSGRLTTQKHIANWFLDNQGSEIVMFGAGLNSIKLIVERMELEYPHLDLLYVVYEGGVVLLLFYLFYMFRFVCYSRFYLYPFALFMSAMHSNLVTTPTLLIIIYFLSFNSRVFSVLKDMEEGVI